MHRKVRVVTEYVREYNSDPMVLSPGDVVKVLKQNDGVYKGWYWCRSADGKEIWVPGQILSMKGENAISKGDFSSWELSVFSGQILEAYNEMGGWLWCASTDGEKGWIPVKNVEYLDDSE